MRRPPAAKLVGSLRLYHEPAVGALSAAPAEEQWTAIGVSGAAPAEEQCAVRMPPSSLGP
jgi:hypothetical protein